MTLRPFGNPSSRLSCICFCVEGCKIYPNKEGRVWKFQHESLTEVVCQTLYYPGKNHANMFSNALALLETFFLFFFVCRIVGINPENYTPPPNGREVYPLGVVTHRQRRAYQRQRHKPRTCQSMVNTLQVDGLARITGLTLLLRGMCACCFVLLNRYWGIVTVPGSFLESGDLGCLDPHPPP